MNRHSRFIAYALSLLCLFHSHLCYATGFQYSKQSLDSVVSKGERTSRSVLVGKASIDSDTIYIDSSGTDMIFNDGANTNVTLTTLATAGAPSNATYITQTANGSLSAEQALTSLTSGILSSDSSTGVLGSRTVTGTASEVDVAAGSSTIQIGIVDPLIVGKGGTGVATVTDGGVVIGKGASAFEDTGLLGKGTIIVGDGVTNPTTLTVGSNGKVLSADSSTASGLAWVEPSPLTAKGDLFTYSTSPTKLLVGSNGQVLSADSSTTSGLSWASPTPLTTKGDINIWGTGNTRLPVGSNGQILSADSAVANGVKWAEASPLTAKGDIFVYGTNLTRLPVGSDGKVLSADSSTTTGLAWVTPIQRPAGSTGQVQFNNNGVFGGASLVSVDTSGLRLGIGPGVVSTVSLDVAGSFRTIPVALTDAATIATDASKGNVFTVTLAGNRTLDQPTNLSNGQKLIYIVSQDSTGSRTLAYSPFFRFGTDVVSPTLSTGAGKQDYLGFIYNVRGNVARYMSADCVAVVKGFSS